MTSEAEDDRDRPGDMFERGWDIETSTSPMEGDISILVDGTKPLGWVDKMLVLRIEAFGHVVKDLTMTAEQAERMAGLLTTAARAART